MTNVDPSRDRVDVLSDKEFYEMLKVAYSNDFWFFSIRNPAILCVLRLTGKRREEMAALKYDDVKMDSDYLYIKFILLKKHLEKPPEKVKAIPLEDPLSKPVVYYKNQLKPRLGEAPEYFWPSVHCVFGNMSIRLDKGLSGKQIYNVVRDTGDKAGVVAWPHLFRETAGAEEVKRDSSLYGIYKVKNRLDIHERTAWHYMERHALNVIRREYGEDKNSV